MFQNLRKVSPFLIARILWNFLLALPWFLAALAVSWIKMRKWRKRSVCRRFLERHHLAFRDIDVSTLEVKSFSGGVSNANEIWTCRTKDGKEIRYFVKIFVEVGSFWAKHLSIVSPFPVVYGGGTHERFTVDMISRVQLTDRNIAVPRMLAYDAVEKVMVTEYLDGENVDEVLKRVQKKGDLSEADYGIIQACGTALAEIHKAGFSLIDTQPVNCIWIAKEKKIYFTDLEYCTQEDKKIWDVGFFICFLAIRLPFELKTQARKTFLQHYQQVSDLNLAGLDHTAKLLEEYLPIFQTILDIRQFTPEELFEELLYKP